MDVRLNADMAVRNTSRSAGACCFSNTSGEESRSTPVTDGDRDEDGSVDVDDDGDAGVACAGEKALCVSAG